MRTHQPITLTFKRIARAWPCLGLVVCFAICSCSSTPRESTFAKNKLAVPTAAAGPATETSPAVQPSLSPQTDYRLQPLDTIDITVFSEPDLSVKRQLTAQGTINYPLLGNVSLSGLTVTETENKLKELLGRSYLVNPQVTVLVEHAGNRRVFILGQVRAPGAYEIPIEGLTVVQAIARAGGFTDIAASDRVNIVRIENGVKKPMVVNVAAIIKGGDKTKDIELKPDDLVSVPETIF